MVIILSKKSASKQKAEQKKQKTRQAKKNRQKHDPLKWEEKKGKKKASQQKNGMFNFLKHILTVRFLCRLFPQNQTAKVVHYIVNITSSKKQSPVVDW